MTIVLSCAGQCLENGDLLFEVAGISEFSKAISSSTAAVDSLQFDHVAMVFIEDNGAVKVIEASPEAGVRKIAIEDFLFSATKIGDKPGVVVKRLKEDYSSRKAVERALKCIGMPYDWWYLPNNGKMYCSELIYECYIDNKGNHIFEARPMNFRTPDGKLPEFWVNLYKELGQPVPEGVLGTNPADLSKDKRLTEIYRYF